MIFWFKMTNWLKCDILIKMTNWLRYNIFIFFRACSGAYTPLAALPTGCLWRTLASGGTGQVGAIQGSWGKGKFSDVSKGQSW